MEESARKNMEEEIHMLRKDQSVPSLEEFPPLPLLYYTISTITKVILYYTISTITKVILYYY
jgi:hypothetical protein